MGVGVLAEGMEKEACEAESEADAGAEPTVADDCERWRIESSEGLRRRSWLLDARWPGVCERGIGGARSCDSVLSSKSSDDCGGRASVGDVAGAILCDRTTFDLCGDCGALSRAAPPPTLPTPSPPLAAAWSAIVGSYDHFSNINSTDEVDGGGGGGAIEERACLCLAVRRRGTSSLREGVARAKELGMTRERARSS